MNGKTIGLIWRLELKGILRSRRAILLSVLLPILLMPLMLLAGRFSNDQQEQRDAGAIYRYALTGDWAIEARALLASARRTAADRDSGSEPFGGQEIREANSQMSGTLADQLAEGTLDFYLETFSAERADSEWEAQEDGANPGQDTTNTENPLARRWPGVPAIRIFFPGHRASAAAGAQKMADFLNFARQAEAERHLSAGGFEIRLAGVLPVEGVNVASDAETSGLLVGRFLTVLLFMLTLTGGSVVAIDMIAGEKERGTLETLLTTAAGRTEIIAAKQLMILATALAITLLQIANLLIYTWLDLLPLPGNYAFVLAPAALPPLILIYVPFAVLIAGSLLLLSTYAKSYKEAQLYFFPLYLIGMFPAAAGAVGEIPLRSAIVVIPIANVSVAVREILSGHVDWAMIGVIVAFNSATALWLLRRSASLLADESRVSARQEHPTRRLHGLQSFRSHLWRWYGVMWAVLFLSAVTVPGLADLRTQAVFNEVIVLLGGSILIVWFYGLSTSGTLALRPVKSGLWIVFSLLIVPLHLTAALVNRFASSMFPLPSSYLEQLAEQFSFEGIPFWQLLLFFAILPAICEEIAFRGPLLYGLRGRFSPIMLAVVVGITFGFFHFTIFRILTTAVIGIAITAIALMTGSIFPGIFLHLGNNALALIFARYELPVDALDSTVYLLAAGSVATLLWIVYRHRSAYPET